MKTALLSCLATLVAAVAVASTVVIFSRLEEEYDVLEELPSGIVVTNRMPARVEIWFEKYGAVYRTAVSLPLGADAATIRNAVAEATAKLAEAHRVPDWAPQEILLP